MPTMLSGNLTRLGTNSAVLAAQQEVDMHDEIAELEPDAAPLTVFTRKMKTGREAFNAEFSWLEDVLAPKVLTVLTGADASQTGTMVLASGDGNKVANNDLIKNPATGEIFLVTSVSTDTPTIVRAFGTTAGAAIDAGQTLLIIGNANKENETIRDIKSTQTVQKTNYCQIFRTPFGISRTQKDARTYGGKELARQANKKGREHRIEIERMFLFGEPKAQTNADSGRWATGGLDYWIQTNRINCQAGLNFATVEDIAQTMFRYGSQKQRLCLAAPIVISRVDLMAESRLFHQTSTEVYGVKINKLTTSHGDLMLVKHPLLQETAAYNERMFILDMDKIMERPYTNAKTKLRKNIQAPSADGEQHEYLTQVGLQVENEVTHGIAFNVA